MTTEQVIGLLLSLLMMGIGLAGCVLPVLPGAPLVFLTALTHRLYFGPAGASTWVLITLAGVASLSFILDFLASMFGARKLGATRRGMFGAIIGGIIGVFFGLPGLVLGPLLGAFLLELSAGRPAQAAAQAGLGTVLGLLAGALGKFVCCLVMMGLFTASVWMNSR